jgi:hypothetical protein
MARRSYGTKKFSKPESDPQKPPLCEEDDTEMELGLNITTHKYMWTCPECGWGYDTEGDA